MFKVNNKDTRQSSTPMAPCSSISIVNFEQLNAGWDEHKHTGKFSNLDNVP